MKKDFENDEELKELLEKLYIEEAEAMEEALFADKDFEDYEMTEEEVRASHERFIAKLKAEGIYREDEADEPKRETVVSMPKKKIWERVRFARVAVLFLVCGICIFAASLTSEANREYWINTIRVMSGNDTRVVIDNDSTNESVDQSEFLAMEDIENQLGIEMPEFFFRPETLEFLRYELTSYSGFSRVEYSYEDYILMFYVYKKDNDRSSYGESIHGESVSSVVTVHNGIQVDIMEKTDLNDKVPNYTAQWELNNTVYQFSGKIKLNDLKNMMREMRY